MDGAADAALGAWAPIRDFFTPATLFLVVNLVIGTIALTSRSRRRGNGRDEDAQRQHHQEPPFDQGNNQYYDDQPPQQQYVPAPAPLARTSSVMDRLRSIGLYRFRSGDFPPEYATPVGTDSRDAVSAPAPAPAREDAQYSSSRSDPAPPRAEIRSPSRMKRSSIAEARTAELPPARVVRSAVLQDEEDDDVVHYANADEFTGGNSFTAHQQAPARPLQHEEEVEEEEQYYREEYVPPLRPAPLARAPSVLERLRSFGLSRFRSGDFPPEYATPVGTDSRDATSAPAPAGEDAQYSRSRPDPAPAPPRAEIRRPLRMKKSSISEAELPPAPAARVVRSVVLEEEDDVVVHYARADEFTAGNSNTFTAHQQAPLPLQHEEEEEHYYREEYVPPLRPAPSVLERLRSFGLSRFRSGDFAGDDAAAAVAELERNEAQKQATQYSRSRSEPSREQSNKGKQESAEARMSKSASVARRKPAAPAVEPEAEEGGVDARADDFINSFRKQLQLQRLNSLLNYKDMINRGA